MVETAQLKEGTLTTFMGFRFAEPADYSYPEAKRVLRLALNELRKDQDLTRSTGMDPELPGRGAITGSDSDGVWDYLQVSRARNAAHHTYNPHLTLGVHRREIEVMVTLANSMRNPMLKHLKELGCVGFVELLRTILGRMPELLEMEPFAVPTVRTKQRRYPAQRAKPFVDAELRFDIRTALENQQPIKHQLQWANAVFETYAHKKSNLQMQIGVIFPISRCETMMTENAIQSISRAWRAHQPLFQILYPDQ